MALVDAIYPQNSIMMQFDNGSDMYSSKAVMLILCSVFTVIMLVH